MSAEKEIVNVNRQNVLKKISNPYNPLSNIFALKLTHIEKLLWTENKHINLKVYSWKLGLIRPNKIKWRVWFNSVIHWGVINTNSSVIFQSTWLGSVTFVWKIIIAAITHNNYDYIYSVSADNFL